MLKVICLKPGAFTTLRGLSLEFNEKYFDLVMAIPAELLAQLTELGLNDFFDNEDKGFKYLEVARHIIM